MDIFHNLFFDCSRMSIIIYQFSMYLIIITGIFYYLMLFQMVNKQILTNDLRCPKSIQIVRRLKLLSTKTQHPELYLLLIQLQLKFINVCLDSNIVKQKSILDLLKLVQ